VATQAIKLRELSGYVMHGSRHPGRRARLETELALQGIEPIWVTEPAATALAPALIRDYYRKSRRLWWSRSTATQRLRFRVLTPREIAVNISHIETYRMIAAGTREWSLIFEDDAVLEPDFGNRFDQYFEELPADADLVFIGSCCGLRIEQVDGERHFYRKDHPATKCADSYLVSRSAAQTILSTIVPFVLTIDWELNYHLKLHDLVVYWVEPPLASQGSQTGVYASSLR
jgi:GR25 family glycosyltransferase involved in LPS biosynthesis